jgi:glycosyltransferase involved in cell wall biosynthesis
MKLTVAIPSYRRPPDLRRGLAALTKQERPPDEVLVIARKDDVATHEAAREFSAALPVRLELVEAPGVVEAYNRALDVAGGDLLSFIDDDAVPHPDWTRRVVETFESDPELAGLGGRDHIFQNGAWVEGAKRVVGVVRWYGRSTGWHHLGVGPRRDVDVLKGVNMSFRMNAVGKTRMDRRLRGSGAQWHCEMKFCLDLRKQGKRLAYDPAIVVDHFPGVRYGEDQRVFFHPAAYEDEVHNSTLALLEYLHPAAWLLMGPYALLVGVSTGYFGLVQALRFWPKMGNLVWLKAASSARGAWAACKTWKTTSKKRD